MEKLSTKCENNQKVSKTHLKLIEAVSDLDGKQRVQSSKCSEPSLEISEYHLVKSGITDKYKIQISDFANTSCRKGRQSKIAKVFNKSKNAQVLPKLLEKPALEKIKRSAGYENLKNDLKKWNSVITQQRTAENVSFPLRHPPMKAEPTGEFVKRFRIQSDLEKELYLIEPSTVDVPKENVLKLSLEEILQRRAETAKLRAEQSYKISKAHRQKKIKSKKYHRIERKKKLKDQLKEFEKLEKTDSVAALEKLKYLEKVRSEERMTLRHKSTGHWAKNKLIRAKYDKESRQELSKQLSIGRDITQKTMITEDDNDDEDVVSKETISTSIPLNFSENPWINNVKTESEVNEFVSQYRKYYDSKMKKKLGKNEEALIPFESASENKVGNKDDIPDELLQLQSDSGEISTLLNTNFDSQENNVIGTSQWTVTNCDLPETKKKKSTFERIDVDNSKNNKRKVKDNKIKSAKRSSREDSVRNEVGIRKKEDKILATSDDVPKVTATKYLKSHLPDENSAECDLLCENDDDKQDNGYQLLHEAFSDEDLVEDFKKEKEEEVNANKPEDVSLLLPGWGRWGGKNIRQPSKLKRKFIIQFSKDTIRKDENKGNVVINEENSSTIRKHQVSELPFPFTNVKDYEASMRAPVGRNFVPEKTHSKLIVPSFRTKMGKIIEPMDEDSLQNIQNLKANQTQGNIELPK